jgi:hypothetical protein
MLNNSAIDLVDLEKGFRLQSMKMHLIAKACCRKL